MSISSNKEKWQCQLYITYISLFLVFNLSTCTAEISTIHCICSPPLPPHSAPEAYEATLSKLHKG